MVALRIVALTLTLAVLDILLLKFNVPDFESGVVLGVVGWVLLKSFDKNTAFDLIRLQSGDAAGNSEPSKPKPQ